MGAFKRARDTIAAAEELQRQAREQREQEKQAAEAAERITSEAAKRGEGR